MPECATAVLTLCKRRPLLELAQEIEQPAVVREALAQQVQVVGHEAVRVDRKLPQHRNPTQGGKYIFDDARIPQRWATRTGADCHEVQSLSDVVGNGETNSLAPEGHRRPSIPEPDAALKGGATKARSLVCGDDCCSAGLRPGTGFRWERWSLCRPEGRRYTSKRSRPQEWCVAPGFSPACAAVKPAPYRA